MNTEQSNQHQVKRDIADHSLEEGDIILYTTSESPALFAATIKGFTSQFLELDQLPKDHHFDCFPSGMHDRIKYNPAQTYILEKKSDV